MQACPINFKRTDSIVGRTASFLTVCIVIASVLGGLVSPLYLLGADLMIRLYGNKSFSPIHRLSEGIKRLCRFPTHEVDAAAKQVAGHFGLLFILLLIVAMHLQMTMALAVIANIYVACLLMDALIGYCVGCKVYFIYLSIKKVF